jgi:hypothetical protein
MRRWRKHSTKKNFNAKLIGSTTSIHHSEPRASLGEILSPTQMNILLSTLLFSAFIFCILNLKRPKIFSLLIPLVHFREWLSFFWK